MADEYIIEGLDGFNSLPFQTRREVMELDCAIRDMSVEEWKPGPPAKTSLDFRERRHRPGAPFPGFYLDKPETRECEYCGSDFTATCRFSVICETCLEIYNKRQESFVAAAQTQGARMPPPVESETPYWAK